LPPRRLIHFLHNELSREAFIKDGHLEIFTRLDDTDILSAVKVWATNDDFVLSKLCTDFVHRKVFHVDITNEVPSQHIVTDLKNKAIEKYGITKKKCLLCFYRQHTK
jgi:hypothetical protein